jgi:hypothetical protein
LYTTGAAAMVLDSVSDIYLRKITPTNQTSTFSALAQFNITNGLSINGGSFFTYTDGNWSPSVTFGTGGPTIVLDGATVGKYVQVGKLVTVSFDIRFSYTAILGAGVGLQITGLPYAISVGASGTIGQFNLAVSISANYGSPLFLAYPSGTAISVCNVQTGSPPTVCGAASSAVSTPINGQYLNGSFSFIK